MFATLLVANRGEIAVRIMRTAKRMGIRTVAVYSDADADAMHVAEADAAVRIGPPSPADSYLNIEAVIAAARESGADAVHPGYGFLSENAHFAEACAAAGIAFVGPPPEAIRAMGDKAAAKARMETAKVPLVPGYHGEDQSPAHLAGAAAEIGYPVLIKAAAGGGGRGMRIVRDKSGFDDELAAAKREAMGAFGDDRVIVEKYLDRPRHIEVQIFADTKGNMVHLFERDCSLQRRYQKVVEEAPAPGMGDARRKKIGAAAVAAAKAIGYVGAGTVEFIVDAAKGGAEGAFYFMEMNTRLQVEHPVTEMITGFDLVEWQLRVAAGEELPAKQKDIKRNGHAIEIRLYAEDPVRGFLPAGGRIARLRWPDGEGVRVDTGVREGDTIAIDYDPMIAKLIAHGDDRDAALALLRGALAKTVLAGPQTNQAFLMAALGHPDFAAGDVDTHFIERRLDVLVPAAEVASSEDLAAALACLLAERKKSKSAGYGEPHSPWVTGDGWRPNLPARDLVRLRDGAEETAIALENSGAGWQGRLPDGKTIRIAAGGTEVVRDGPALIVLRDGHQRRFEEVRPLETVDNASGATGSLTAPMPGKVVQVLVSTGEMVTRGQTLMILEAMKMEHAIAAPADGKVAEIAYVAGDQVAEGVELLRLSTDGEEG